LKILHVNTFDKGGGAEDFAFDFVQESGFDCSLCVKTRYSTSEKVFELQPSILDWFFSFLDKILFKLSIQKTFRQLFSLTEIANFTYQKLKKHAAYAEADIIHLHNIHGGFFDIAAFSKIAREKKIVWTLHDMWALTGGEAYTFGNENFKKGIGYTPFGDHYPLKSPALDLRQYYLNKKKKTYTKIARNAFLIPDAIWLQRQFEESYVFNPVIHVRTIYCGIDTKKYFNKNNRHWSVPRVLIINSKSAFKGSEIFKEVFSVVVSTYELHVIGGEIDFKTSASLVKQYDYFNDRESLGELFNNVDILIFPTKADICPLTILMAMSCGVCVISTYVGGIPELLDSGCGKLFDRSNSSELLNVLNESLHNLEGTRKMGINASEKAKNNYDSRLMYENYRKVYSDILKTE
jgi:glycosyltransferase involved in cell wall biosynthesis